MMPFSEKSLKGRIIRLLQANPKGLTIIQLRDQLRLPANSPQQHLDKRVREIREYYNLPYENGVYVLGDRLISPKNAAPVDKTTRARILHRDAGRCQMCGRTIEDGIKLHIDHKIPREWGGQTEDENLWALCAECNEGKRNFFSSIADERVRDAMAHKSVHVRIGELLKNFGTEPIPKNLLAIVASSTHEDWEKRLRELREIGWRYTFERRKDPTTGRVRVYFVLRHAEPWPEGSVAAAIRTAERKKNSKR